MDKDENKEGKQSPKKRYNFRKKTRQAKRRNYKIGPPQSDTDSDSDWEPVKNEDGNETDLYEYLTDKESEDESDEEKNIEDDDMNTLELQRFIQKIFPSNSGKERLQQLEKLDKMVQKQKQKKVKNAKKSSINSHTQRKTGKRKKKKKVKKSEQKADDEMKTVKGNDRHRFLLAYPRAFYPRQDGREERTRRPGLLTCGSTRTGRVFPCQRHSDG